MAQAAPGEVPRDRGDINRDLAGKTPQTMVTMSEVRKGWGAILKDRIRFLSADGVDKNDEISNTMISADLGEFNSLMKGIGNDERLMARLVADAAKVVSEDKQGQDKPIYMEGLEQEGKRLANRLEKTSYPDLAEDRRLSVAGFLLRPPEDRPLTWFERVVILYPKAFVGAKDRKPDFDEVMDVGKMGMRKILRTVIEAGPLASTPSTAELEQKYTERRWLDFIHQRPCSEDSEEMFGKQDAKEVPRKQDPEDGKVDKITVSGYLPHFNLPRTLEYLMRDVINYMSLGLPGNREERDLDKIVPEVMKVLPHRKRLEEVDYFHKGTSDGVRLNKLQDIFEGRALF